jgi:hypothetical protein
MQKSIILGYMCEGVYEEVGTRVVCGILEEDLPLMCPAGWGLKKNEYRRRTSLHAQSFPHPLSWDLFIFLLNIRSSNSQPLDSSSYTSSPPLTLRVLGFTALKWEPHHWLPWFWDLWIWTETGYRQLRVSSQQITYHGTFQLPKSLELTP